MDPHLYEALKSGLSQITREGLERLREHILAGRPLMLDSSIYVRGKGG